MSCFGPEFLIDPSWNMCLDIHFFIYFFFPFFESFGRIEVNSPSRKCHLSLRPPFQTGKIPRVFSRSSLACIFYWHLYATALVTRSLRLLSSRRPSSASAIPPIWTFFALPRGPPYHPVPSTKMSPAFCPTVKIQKSIFLSISLRARSPPRLV